VETAIGLLISLIRNKQGQPESTVHNQSTGSLLGGTGRTIESEEFAFGDCTFNLSAHVIKRRGHIVKFTQTEYKLLAFLVRNRGKVLGHQEILHSVWGAEYTEAKEDLRTFIAQLRKKLEDDPSNPKFIITEQGVGYRFQENEEFIKHSLIPF
jgi:DNA-binding response OmpR family regulator